MNTDLIYAALAVLALIGVAIWLIKGARNKVCVKCGATDAYIEADEGKICSRCFYSFRGQYPTAGE